MKNLSTLLIVLTLSTGSALAAEVGPGNPVREKDSDSLTFDLTRGYFSLFNLFIAKEEEPDTLRFDQYLRDRKIELMRRPR